MPTYPYKCEKCEIKENVVKYMSESDRSEACPQCNNPMERDYSNMRLNFIGTKVESAEYNPGLGVVTKNAKDRAEIAKRKGVTEIGNDYKSADHISAEFAKAREEKLKKTWED
jgi:putative FmdB family regulatory protein